MDSFEFNKIAGAVLATALGVMALSIVSEVIFHPAAAVQPGYVVAGVDPTGDEHGGAGQAPAGDVPPIAVRLATADVAAGERSMGKCRTCHTFTEGDVRRTPGPNLWEVVGATLGHQEGYGYSAAFVERHAAGEIWTYEHLDDWLENPRATVPGTAMTFAGLKRPDERTNVIAYLRTLSDSPVPLPEVPTAADGEAGAAAEHAAPPPAEQPATEPPPAEPAPPPAGGTTPEAPAE